MSREIKLYENRLKVGVFYYEELHNRLTQETEMKNIKKIFDAFTKEHDNPFMCGIDIKEGYVYIITHKKTGKKYIGQTCDLIKRMTSYIEESKKVSRTNMNRDLHKDIVLYGLSDFTIEFIKTEEHIEMEKNLIINSKTELYNIEFNKNAKKLLPKKRQYIIGNKNFDTKKEIFAYNRSVLDSYKPNTYIKKDSDVYNFVSNLIKYNPSYQQYFEKYECKIKIVKDNYNENYGSGIWNIFCIEWVDEKNKLNEWVFSTKKCIDNI